MPSNWQYHADGVNTAVRTDHDLDGTLNRVRVQLDAFRVRSWTEDVDEIEERTGRDIDTFSYDEVTDGFEEYGDGSHATFWFTVPDGIPTLQSIEPEDGDRIEPRHFALLPAVERVVEQLDGVGDVPETLGSFRTKYRGASDVHIDALDG